MFSFYTKHPLSIQWWFLKLLAWATTPRTQGPRESTDFATNFQCVKYCKVPYSSSPVIPQKRSAKVFKNRLIPVSSWDFHGFSRLSTVPLGVHGWPCRGMGFTTCHEVTKAKQPVAVVGEKGIAKMEAAVTTWLLVDRLDSGVTSLEMIVNQQTDVIWL